MGPADPSRSQEHQRQDEQRDHAAAPEHQRQAEGLDLQHEEERLDRLRRIFFTMLTSDMMPTAKPTQSEATRSDHSTCS